MSYYNQPLLKPPVWTWEVPAYFFLGGIAGVAAVLAALASMAGADETLARDARWVAVIGALGSPALLISDLGRPSRFLFMMRVFKARSPMSLGAWTLAVFTPAAIAALVWTPIGIVAALAGLVLATYTGVLLGATAIPVWSAHVRLLPLHFGASSLGATVSILELLGHRTAAMNALGLAAAVTITATWLYLEFDRRPSSTPLRSGPSGRLTRIADLLAGLLPFVLRLTSPAVPAVRIVAAIAAIAGSLVSRFGWIAAGRASVALALALLIAPLQAAQQPAKPDLSTRALVTTASRYVATYQEQFKFLLADEEYTQSLVTATGELILERRIKGEMFLTYLAGDGDWIAVHDFAEVDGRAVSNRDDVRVLLQKSDARGVAGRIANRNAQYNIGRLDRNINQPTLPLLLLSPKRVKTLNVDRREVVQRDGRTVVVLGFRETERPTLVRDARGVSLFSKGAITIDAHTGRIERTEIEVAGNAVRSWLTTEYAPDEKLDLWVPTTFRERYEGTFGRDREFIHCEARFTNYRRFEVTGRIK